MYTITPYKLSDYVLDFARSVVPGAKPVYLEVRPGEGAKALDCFSNVERVVSERGGSACYGWQVWETPGVMIEAEFHAVWQDDEGQLHDITPKHIRVEQILFVPDPNQKYEGRQVNSIRRALSTAPEVAELIAACDAEFSFMNLGERANQHMVTLTGSEALELDLIQRRKRDILLRIEKWQAKPGRYDPCPCGSGKKFKWCHGR